MISYDLFPRFGGKPINQALVRPLNTIPWAVLRVMKNHVSQGAGGAPASKGTHREGYCIDLSTRRLAGATIRRIIGALEEARQSHEWRCPFTGADRVTVDEFERRMKEKR